MKSNKTRFATLALIGLINSVGPWSQANAEIDVNQFLKQWPLSHFNYADDEKLVFPLTRPAVLSESCLPNAKGVVKVRSLGNVELMDVKVTGLSPNTEYDVFVIQVPNFPFGMSWYQGDLQTKSNGKGYANFVGRFNKETFIVAPGSTIAPLVHDDQFPDAAENPQTAPVHTYHIGIWFNSPQDAANAGCPDITTPFNGEHNAGIQILNTGSFQDDEGPLLQLEP